MTVLDRFLNYIDIDTTSDSNKEDTPSTEGQITLARQLVEELLDIGIMNIYFDREHGYLYAKISQDGKYKIIRPLLCTNKEELEKILEEYKKKL